MQLTVRQYQPVDAPSWDSFVEGCLQATFLHSRRFLSYHGDRFEDASLIIELDGECVGLFAAAVSPSNQANIVSHPGITYGGIVHQGKLRGEQMVHALRAICDFYEERGYLRLAYKAMPSIYQRFPAQDDIYALFRLDFFRVRCDLSSAIDLNCRLPVATRRRRGLKKAARCGVAVASGKKHAVELWNVLSANLREKFDKEPVHSIDEMLMLSKRFPENVRFVCGLIDEKVVAGVVLFETPNVTHAQYIASGEAGYQASALDAVFEDCIETSARAGKRWFDFGISNENGGRLLNEGLYDFKSNFGGGGIVHEFYELEFRAEKRF